MALDDQRLKGNILHVLYIICITYGDYRGKILVVEIHIFG